MSGPNPKMLSVFFIKMWSMLSKAFLKSMRMIMAFFFLSLMCLIRFSRFRRMEPILFDFMYAFCCLPMMLLTAGFMRWVMAQLAIL